MEILTILNRRSTANAQPVKNSAIKGVSTTDTDKDLGLIRSEIQSYSLS